MENSEAIRSSCYEKWGCSHDFFVETFVENQKKLFVMVFHVLGDFIAYWDECRLDYEEK